MQTTQVKSPWLWVPSLYFGQAIPYVVVMMLSVIMYKANGISNTDIALYTSWLYLPWVIKPLWSPFVDMFRTKRFWIVGLQLVIGAALALVALTAHMSSFFQMSLAVLWLMAFSSATHDIAADGFYMLGLRTPQQAAFVGVDGDALEVVVRDLAVELRGVEVGEREPVLQAADRLRRRRVQVHHAVRVGQRRVDRAVEGDAGRVDRPVGVADDAAPGAPTFTSSAV